MFKTLRKNLIFDFILVALFVLVINTTISIYQMKTGLENQMKYDGIVLANTIKNNIEHTDINDVKVMQSIIDDIYEDSNGGLYYIGIVSKDRTLIAGTAKDAIGEKITDEEIDPVFKGETIAYMNKWKGTSACNVTVPLGHGDEINLSLSVGIYATNMQNTINSGIVQAIIASIILLGITSLIGVFVGGRIAKPIESIKETVEKVGNGDLTAEYSAMSNRNSEIETLVKASQQATVTLKDLIRKVKSISKSLNNLSKSLLQGEEEMAAASDEIANSITSVSQEGVKQTEDLELAVGLLENFSDDLNGVNFKLSELLNQGEYIKQDANNGAEKINELSDTIEDMQVSFDHVKNKVNNLDVTISQINSIVDVINSVAAQTNLLALNASIEAARAGEAGRGFSVVAEEIRKLAEEVLTSSKSITQLVNKVMDETHEVSDTTDIAANRVVESKNNVEDAVNSFREIINNVNDIPREINEVSTVLQGTIESRDRIVGTIKNVTANSQEISSLSEEVTASTEEQAAITHEMAITANKLNNIAKALEKSVKGFKA